MQPKCFQNSLRRCVFKKLLISRFDCTLSWEVLIYICCKVGIFLCEEYWVFWADYNVYPNSMGVAMFLYVFLKRDRCRDNKNAISYCFSIFKLYTRMSHRKNVHITKAENRFRLTMDLKAIFPSSVRYKYVHTYTFMKQAT